MVKWTSTELSSTLHNRVCKTSTNSLPDPRLFSHAQNLLSSDPRAWGLRTQQQQLCIDCSLLNSSSFVPMHYCPKNKIDPAICAIRKRHLALADACCDKYGLTKNSVAHCSVRELCTIILIIPQTQVCYRHL